MDNFKEVVVIEDKDGKRLTIPVMAIPSDLINVNDVNYLNTGEKTAEDVVLFKEEVIVE